MAEKKKVTEMLLKVHDLECSKCYKKVKNILCTFPQIQDQVYDEKNNTVKIKVVCCSPEKIRDKIRCKGRGIIISIEIVIKPPEKTKPPETTKPPEKTKPPETTKPPEKPKPPEVNIDLKNTIVINFKPCYCGRNCDGCCERPVNCSCGCGGNRGNCGSRCPEYYCIEDNSQGCSIL